MTGALRTDDVASSRSGESRKGARHGYSGVYPLDVPQRLDLKVDYRLVLVCVAHLEEIRTLEGVDTHILIPLTLEEGQVTLDAILLDKDIGDLVKGEVRWAAFEKPHLRRAP